MYEPFTDPVLELARRCRSDDGDVGYVFDLASEVDDEQARLVLEAIDETEAEMRASSLARDLRAAGQIW
jgi:hypothetical protein